MCSRRILLSIQSIRLVVLDIPFFLPFGSLFYSVYNLLTVVFFFFFFFFQAEDGIRDTSVTGVQTCALPIFVGRRVDELLVEILRQRRGQHEQDRVGGADLRREDRRQSQRAGERRHAVRSEERRVGKECRSRWAS